MVPVTSSSSTLRPDTDETLSCFMIINRDSLLAAPDNLTQSLSSDTVADWGRSESKAIGDFHVELEKTSEAILASDTNNRKTSKSTGEQSRLTAAFSPASPDAEHHKYDIFPGSGQSRLLEQHEVKSSDNRPFQCTVCYQRFEKKSNFKEHITVVHQNNRPFHCEKCDKKFKRLRELTRHKETHSNERPFHCNTCGKAFNSKRYLTQHKKTHDDKYTFQCAACGKHFRKKDCFMMHLGTHQDVKQKTNITHSETVLANTGDASPISQLTSMNNQTSINDIHVNKSQDQKEYEEMITLLNELQEQLPVCYVKS